MWAQKTSGSRAADSLCVESLRMPYRSRGVTVSTLDPESSDRRSNPREVSLSHPGPSMVREQRMVPRGLEPGTLRLLAVRSSQLSYEADERTGDVGHCTGSARKGCTMKKVASCCFSLPEDDPKNVKGLPHKCRQPKLIRSVARLSRYTGH